MLDELSGADFTRLEFVIEFEDAFVLQQEMVLRLRRELRKAAQAIAADDPVLGGKILNMLDPEVAVDPYARKIFQKPAPPFVIKPPKTIAMKVDAGDQVVMEVLFFGDLVMYGNLFCLLLKKLGTLGFWQGEGRFDLVNLYGLGYSGERVMLPLPEEPNSSLPVPMISLAWVIEEKFSFRRAIWLEFITPARVMTSGKPLFHVSFTELFPFLLRRVTSILYMWYGLEPVDDARGLIAMANDIVIVSSDLHWRDWRTLENSGGKQDLGGVAGGACLGNIWSDELLAVLSLGELTNIGKNAAYGCGHFRLRAAP